MLPCGLSLQWVSGSCYGSDDGFKVMLLALAYDARYSWRRGTGVLSNGCSVFLAQVPVTLL
jgi:hypothetical protein